MGDHLWEANHFGLQPANQANSAYTGWVMSTDSVMMLCSWGIKVG